MIRWFFAVLGGLVALGAMARGARIRHGQGSQRPTRPIRPIGRVVIAAFGLLWVWFVLSHTAR